MKKLLEKKIPIFALVEKQVFSEFRVYQHNKKNNVLEAGKISFPSVDSTNIFDFIETVENNAINNAIEPFSEYNELELYLKQQWAGMMFNFLTRQIDTANISLTLDSLKLMNERIEFLSKQILSSVGTDTAKLVSKMYDRMLGSESIRDLATAGIKVTPKEILQNDDLGSIIKGKIEVKNVKGFIVAHANSGLNPAYFSRLTFEKDKGDYANIREELLEMISKAGKSIEEVLQNS